MAEFTLNDKYLNYVTSKINDGGFYTNGDDQRVALLIFAGYMPFIEDGTLKLDDYYYFSDDGRIKGNTKTFGSLSIAVIKNDVSEHLRTGYDLEYRTMFSFNDHQTVPPYWPQFTSACWLIKERYGDVEQYHTSALEEVYVHFTSYPDDTNNLWPNIFFYDDEISSDDVSYLTTKTIDAFFTFLPIGFREKHRETVEQMKANEQWDTHRSKHEVASFINAVKDRDGWDFYKMDT